MRLVLKNLIFLWIVWREFVCLVSCLWNGSLLINNRHHFHFHPRKGDGLFHRGGVGLSGLTKSIKTSNFISYKIFTDRET